jgi:hypothetical protein
MLPFKGEEYRGTYILGTDDKLYTKDEYKVELGSVSGRYGSTLYAPKQVVDILSVEVEDTGGGVHTYKIRRKDGNPISVDDVLNIIDGAYATQYDSNTIIFDVNMHQYPFITLKGVVGTPVGVAVVEPESQFVVAPQDSGSNMAYSSVDTLISNIVTTTKQDDAQLDYRGKYNTEQMISQIGDQATSAKYCNTYVFKNGQTGYFGALGQWNLVSNNKSSIDELLSLIGASSLASIGTSSTQYNAGNNWILDLSVNIFSSNSKSTGRKVRAFTDLILYDEISLENAIITLNGKKVLNTNSTGDSSTTARAFRNHSYQAEHPEYSPKSGLTGILNSDTNIDIVLEQYSPVIITVKENTEDGTTVSNTSIRIQSSDNSLDYSTTTTEDGMLTTNLPVGTYTVTLEKKGYTKTISTLEVVGGANVATLTIRKNYQAIIKVLRSGEPVSGADTSLIAESQESIIEQILAKMGCVLFKRTGDKAGTFIRLHQDSRLKYFDGSNASLNGTEGDVMVYMPEYYYKYENLGGTKFAYRFSRVSLGDDWIHVPASLIGAYMCYCTDNKMYSRSGVNPTASISWTNFNNYAIARGTGYQMIDYWQHCQIAMLFYAKYKNRNSQAVLGVGSATYDPITIAGGTDNLGNNDTQQTTSGWVNFQGIEGVFGGAYECVGGVSISSRVWTITNPDGTTRTVNAGTEDGWITKMALENGPYFDMVPTAVGGSDSTYYSDYYYYQSTGTYVLYRSYDSALTYGGVAFAFVDNTASSAGTAIGSRLAFRGTLTESTNVEEFKSIIATES